MSLVLYLTAVVAFAAVWRGLESLMDLYLCPKNPKLSYWVSFLIGFTLLAIILPLIELK